MTVVVDIGCYDHPDHQGASQDSIGRLIERFRPFELLGFDPHPKMPERSGFGREETHVTIERAAAWIWDGTIGYDPQQHAPLGAFVGESPFVGKSRRPTGEVRCFDLAELVRNHQDERLILKIDAEGAEYPLLRHLIRTAAIGIVDRLLVEWHGDRAEERDELLARIPCPVEEWS